MSAEQKGTFIGVGVGPGDPELITLKALRLIQRAPVISFLVNEKGHSQGKTIAREAFDGRDCSAQQELPVVMPMSTDRSLANAAYDQAATAIAEQLDQGLDVVFICEGDPLFFGSFAYLLERLENNYTTQVVPGISSVNASASALQLPLTMLKESFAVISGRHREARIRQTLEHHDSVVIMKAGRARPRILKALRETGRLAEANYLENIGRADEVILKDISALADEAGPYFSLFVILRAERDRS